MLNPSNSKEYCHVTGKNGVQGSRWCSGTLANIVRRLLRGGTRRCPVNGACHRIRNGRKNQSRYYTSFVGRRLHRSSGSDGTCRTDRRGHHHPKGDRFHSSFRLVVSSTYNRIVDSYRHARIFGILACLFIVFFGFQGRANAIETHSIAECLKLLSEKLKTDSALKEFSKYTSSEKFEIDRGLAEIEFQENLYAGSSKVLGEVAGNYDASVVSGAYAQDVAGESAAAAGGSVETAIGGEAMDVARAAGWLDPWAAVVGLVPLGGLLVYEDLSSGSNFITDKYLSDEIIEPTPAQEDVAAEQIAWAPIVETEAQRVIERGSTVGKETRNPGYWEAQYIYWRAECPGEGKLKYLFGNEFHCSASEAILPPQNIKMSAIKQNTYGSCPHETAPGYPGEEAFVLGAKVSGEWFFGTCVMDPGLTGPPAPTLGEMLTEEGMPLGGIVGNSSICYELSGKTTTGGTKAIIGMPFYDGDRTSKTATEYGCQEPFGPYKSQDYDAFGLRRPSHMKMGFPRAMSKAEVEKLESEKRIVHKNSPKSTEEGTLPEVAKKVAKKMEENCRYVQAIDHWNKANTGGTSTKCSSAKPGEQEPELPGTAKVPDCVTTNISGTSCVSLLKSAGFTKITLNVVTWEHAVITKPADATISVSPGGGSVVETSTSITVDANPKEGEFPVAIPFIKFGKETGDEYKERLEREGWTKVEVRILPESATNPNIGPSQASYTVPAEGTEVNPSQSTDIIVEANPTTAPEPEAGGGIGGPTLPGFNIPNFGVLCKGFPFGVPCWLVKTIESWSAASACPVWSIGEYTIHGKKIPEASINLCSYGLEPIMEKARVAMLIFSTLGLVLLFYRFAKGGSPGSGGSQDIGYSLSNSEQDSYEGL